jgi:phosphoglycolate phosphatase-like HAD superfamily hydrolase
MGLCAGDVLYVGDAVTDLQAAQAAGVDFGLARWGCVRPFEMEGIQHDFSCPEALLQLI